MLGSTAGRAPALAWFVAAACGAHLGVGAPRLLPVAPLLALALAAAASGVFGRLRGGWRSDALFPQVAMFAAIALALAAASAARYQEFLRWEGAWKRGDRMILTGRIRELAPYAGNRLAVGIDAGRAYGLGQGWRIRLIADPQELLAALSAFGEGGNPRLPVRVYPFTPAGNPGEFDRRLWALGKGYLANAYLDLPTNVLGASASEPSRTPPGEGSFDLCASWPLLQEALASQLALTQRLAWRWRCRLLGAEQGPAAAISLAMTLGQRDRVDDEWNERFQRAGAAHLLAVSGLHVGFLLLLVAPPILRERWGRFGWLGALLPALAVCAFVDLTGRAASALRAGIMAVTLLAASAAGRACSGWQRVGLAGLALLFYNPHLVFDLGFRLSFLATAAIVAVAAPLARTVGRASRRVGARRIGVGLLGSIGVSVAATWGTLPLAVASFSVIPWLSPLVNVAAVPLGAGVLTLTLGGLIAGEIWAAGGAVLVSLGRWCAELLCDLVATVPEWAATETAMLSPPMALGWYLTGIGGALLLRGWARPQGARGVLAGRRALVIGLAFVAAASGEPVSRSLLGGVEVWTLDVGQGDAILVRGPWGRAVLVDGGGVTGRAAASGYDVGRTRVVPTLRRLGVRRVDAVVNTHPDADHVQGLAAVVAERPVRRVFASYATSASASYRRFLHAVEAAGIRLEHLGAGDRLVLSRNASLRVLAGGDLSEWTAWGGTASVNDRSVALLLEAHGRRFLLLGDMQTRGVRRLLAIYSDLEAEGLLIPHHGGRLPILGALLDRVRPRLAAISAGAGNAYGHPAPETLEALAERGIRVLRTDRHGAIRLSFWPWGVRVETVRREPRAEGR